MAPLGIDICFNNASDFTNEIGNFFLKETFPSPSNDFMYKFQFEGNFFDSTINASINNENIIHFSIRHQGDKLDYFESSKKIAESVGKFLSKKFVCKVDVMYSTTQLFGVDTMPDCKTEKHSMNWSWKHFNNGIEI